MTDEKRTAREHQRTELLIEMDYIVDEIADRRVELAELAEEFGYLDDLLEAEEDDG